MGWWSDWQAARDRERRVERYLHQLLRVPDAEQVAWLSGLGGQAAERELTFARRALGLIVAERDALDDRTAADVAHRLHPVLVAESRRDAAAGRAWSDRWRAYTTALAVRGTSDTPAMRLGRVLLDGAGIAAPDADAVAAATRYIQESRAQLNEALRDAFGAATLPEDVRPSALQG